MLAKPEYSSPPDEVCCWQGRRARAVAGRSAAAKVLNGRGHCGRDLSGRSCWPGAARFVAGQGAMAERLQRGGAMAELLLAWGAAKCGKEGGALRGGGDPALGNKGVLGAGGLYLNQLRGFCFVVPCQSSK